MQELLTRDFSEVPSLIWEIIVDPASRPVEAMLIFGILVVFLVMLLLLVLVFVMKDDDEAEHAQALEDMTVETVSPAPAPRRRRIPAGVAVVLGVIAWWIATGITTAADPVCLSCHADSDHALTQVEADPHGSTACVSCHEEAGPVGSVTVAVPRRVEHIVGAIVSAVPAGEYGRVASSSCDSCHESAIALTTTNEVKAVKVSHAEPIQAGAACLDCHVVRDGVIGGLTTKMQPCLRCHDGETAPSECDYCHVDDIALAVSGRSEPSTATAQPLVSDPQCGGCHSQETCDACHGIRMPHTQEFMAYAHAREGVEDIWYNGGETCGKCHYPGNKPCTGCHTGRFPAHGSGFRFTHGASGAEGSGCDTCHAVLAYRNGRDFCVDLCHSED